MKTAATICWKASSWFASTEPFIVGIPRGRSFVVRFVILEPKEHQVQFFTGRLYCTERALWKLNWFLRDFGYDPDLLNRDQVDEKALLNLQGVVRTSHVTLNGRSFQNLEAFAPAAEWEELSCEAAGGTRDERNGDDL